MRNRISSFSFCLLLCLFPLKIKAQRLGDANGGMNSTHTTNTRARMDARKLGPKKATYHFIIKNDSKNTLKGNKCFEEVTHKFGFEYLIAPQDLPPNTNGFKRWSHNLGVKFILFFRNGPGWQLRLQKRYKECKYRYGDFVG
jgi:hypothetical protein